MDYGPVWMRNEKIREMKSNGIAFHLFEKREGVGMSSQEFVNDCFKCLISTFVGRPQFVNLYYTFIGGSENIFKNSLPVPQEVQQMVSFLDILQNKSVKIGKCFTAQYDVCEELSSYEAFRIFLLEYASVHPDLFYKEVVEKSIDDHGAINRRVLTDNWVHFAGQHVPGMGGSSQKFLFHIYKAIKAIEGTYGCVFGEETLSSVPIGYGAHQAWLNINRESFITNDNRASIKQERSHLLSRRRGIKTKPRYWSDLMTEAESSEIFSRMKRMDDWQLECMLMKLDKTSGKLVNIITGAPIGCYVIDVFFCESYRIIRKMSRTYNISVQPKFHLPYTHPFKNKYEVLSIEQDKRLYYYISNGSRLFECVCGNSDDYQYVYRIPPEVFCTEVEVKAFNAIERVAHV
jgi:hypothetical protein